MKLSNRAFNAIVMRYSDRNGRVNFEDFISCVIKLKTMFSKFNLFKIKIILKISQQLKYY